MTDQQISTQRQGAVIGGWVCIVLGTALMVWTLLSFLLYLPLFLAAFVLGIVAIAQRRLANGISILLLSVVVPLVFGIGLGAYRTQQAMEDVRKTETDRATPLGSETTPTTEDLEFAPSPEPTPEEQYIAGNIELYEFEAKYMDSVLDGLVPGVTFKIKNNGGRTLDRVEVVVLFKDASGSVIAEEDYFPIFVSEFNLSGDTKPLKPGYIWQQERGKFFAAKSVPSEWKEGAAEIKIVDIRFQDERQ